MAITVNNQYVSKHQLQSLNCVSQFCSYSTEKALCGLLVLYTLK